MELKVFILVIGAGLLCMPVPNCNAQKGTKGTKGPKTSSKTSQSPMSLMRSRLGITTQQMPRMSTPRQPGMSSPRQPGQPGMSTPRLPGQPGMSSPRQPGQPGMSTPPLPGVPGMSSPRQPGQPGMSTPRLPGQPGMSSPRQPGQPGMSTPRIPGQAGMSTPRLPGMSSPRLPGQPGMSTPRLPRMSSPRLPGQPGMSTPPLPGVPGMSSPRQPGQPGMSTPRLPGQAGMSTPRLPGMSSPRLPGQPGMSTPRLPGVPGMSTPRPPRMSTPRLPSGRPVVPTGAPVPVVFPCPRECQTCQRFRDVTKNCMAVDQYGTIKQKYFDILPQRTQDDYTFLSNTSLFETTAYMATCDGMKFYLKVWAGLTSRQQDNLLDFIKDPTLISLRDQKALPKVAFSILEPRVERAMFKKMNDDQKLAMCKDLTYVDCFTRVAIDRNINCGRILLASGTADAKSIASLVDVRNCSNWDKEQWNLTMKYSPDILDMECLKIAPPDVMVSNVDSLSQHCDKLDRRSINILANITTSKLINDKQNGKTITSAEKDSLADLLSSCGADPSIMGDLMDKSEMLSKVDYSKTDTKKGIKFMKEVLQTVQPKDMKKDQIVNSFKMMVFNRTLLNELDSTELEAAVCDICDKADDFDSTDLAKLTDVVIKRVPSLADPSTYDQAKLDCIGPLIQFLPMASFDSIPASSLRDAVSNGKMKNVTITSKKMGKKLLSAAKDSLGKTNGDFSSSDLEKIGSGVAAMDGSDIDKIPSGSFSDSVIELFAKEITKSKTGNVKPPKSMIASLMKKIETSPTAVKKAIESGLGADIPTQFLQNADISDLPDITGDSSEVTIEVDEKRAKILMDKVKAKIGDVSGTDSNFTIQRFSNIKKIACGLTVEDIKNITNDGERIDKMNAITKSPCIKQEQVDAAKKAYKESTDFDSSTDAEVESNTDSSTLSQTAPNLLAQFSFKNMKKFGTSNKDAIVSTIAKADTEVLSKDQMKDGFKFVMDSLGKASSGDITKDDLDSCGTLVCGIDNSALSRLDSDALDEYATKIDKCPLGSTERRTLGSTLMSKLDLKDGSKVDAASVMTLGTSVSEMSDSQLDAIDSSILCDMSDKISTTFKEKEEKDKKRRKKGFKMDTTANDDRTYKANKKRVMKKLLSVQDACSSSSSSGSSGRRKRSASSLTCSYMRNIGTSGLSALTLDQINNLDDTEFTDCIDILGAVTDYSDAQKQALADVGKRNTVWGTPTTWAASTVSSAGVIVQGLSVAEIETLTLDLDSISKLGEFDGWSDAQKKALFDRWLTLTKSSDASTITSSELRSLGHMTCGAETSHIDVIPHAVYSSAVDAVGEVTSCTEGQLNSFAALAKTAYGSDVTLWSTTTISNLGVVIGGLSQSELSTLSDTQIDSIDSNHISYIPPTSFSGFTTSQISTFSASQAQSTSVDQRNALDSSQLAALSAVAGTTFSGCEMMRTSLSLAVFLAIISMYFGRN